METAQPPFVSVIIPVFNNAQGLKLCIAALEKQSYPKACFEIIVIDNGSDNLEEIRVALTPFKSVRFAVEQIPGSYAARNRGVQMALGDVIAFTDSDCIPTSDWLEKGVSHLQNSENCGQVLGRVNLFFKDPNAPTLVEIYESLTALKQDQLLIQSHGGATANMFTRKQIIQDVGPFNTRLKSSGDIEWGQRIHAAGYEQRYAEDVVINHPARRTFKALHQRTVRLSGGGYSLCMEPKTSHLERHKMFLRLLVDEFTLLVAFVVKLFENSDVQNGWLKTQLVFLSIYVRSVSVVEKIRLKLGGATTR